MEDGKCKKSVGGVRDDVLDITDGVNTICDAFQHLLKKQDLKKSKTDIL